VFEIPQAGARRFAGRDARVPKKDIRAAEPQPKEQTQKRSPISMKCFPRYFQRLLKPEA
jgi:hypothetical protein